MQFVQFLFSFHAFFVKFTKFSHHVHNLFIIGWYTLFKVKEEIRLPDNKAYKIIFFIIAQAPRGVWALLILESFGSFSMENFPWKRLLSFCFHRQKPFDYFLTDYLIFSLLPAFD